jgi:hypothetical protein
MTSITEIAERYIASHDVSDGHAKEMRGHAKRYGSDLTYDALNANLKALRQLGRSDSYIRNRRVYVLMLWRFAASLDILPDPPMSKIMKVRRRDFVPRGYVARHVAQLVDVAGRLRGRYASGITRADWWTSFILAAWDTGLSVCDMLAVVRSWIGADGEFVTVRHKTGKRVKVGFHESTLAVIDGTFPPERKLIWPLTISREMMRKTFHELVESAKVGGSLKWLRSGSGTSVDELHGHGEQHLGNTRQIFERHYLCSSLQARLPEEVSIR